MKSQSAQYRSGHYADPKAAKKEGNPPFFQFTKHAFPVVRQLLEKNSAAARIFFFFVDTMNKENALVVSQQAITDVLGIGRTTVWKSVKYLEDNKFIKIVKSGHANIYVLNADIVWQKSLEGKKFAKFSAQVFVMENEQVPTYNESLPHISARPSKNNKMNTARDSDFV
jgi:hypothetical protein